DVEVARVEVSGIEKTRACIAVSRPVIIQPREPALIEALESSGGRERSEKALVRDPQDDEDECGNERPGEEVRIFTSQPEGGGDCHCGGDNFAKAEESVALAVMYLLRFERGQSPAIDTSCIGRRRHLRLRVQADCGASALTTGALMEGAA